MAKLNYGPRFGNGMTTISPRNDPDWFSKSGGKTSKKSGKRCKSKQKPAPRGWDDMIAKIPPKREDYRPRKRWSTR